ncbi:MULTISPECIES: hypothetical protein [unclassified Anabaena]|uniref:hypothetical protein n=1 Tax=unclassified Anabaena TaxID=2619674 RepID=UPI0016822EAD|nr:hypothetical protein [Anabaena sp. UHCC 0399]MBD2363963.1 hypothetical protein [Anabaena minutissima FACHB-250]MEA5566590.1 hypothetical protein [Anabaena sp. UHCC 0399]
MTQTSNIRKLLIDGKLGLLPYLDQRLSDIEQTLKQQKNLQLQPYDVQLGGCNTLAANEPRPAITQSVSLKFILTGNTQDKLELLLLASELQNDLDAAIFEWSNREWHQFEKPLKRPVTQITGGLDYEVLDKPNPLAQITIYREFDLIYPVGF